MVTRDMVETAQLIADWLANNAPSTLEGMHVIAVSAELASDLALELAREVAA